MLQKIISKRTKANLEILTKEAVLKNFYLAGGTGAALQLKHRVSLDLDFFTKEDIDTKILIQKIKTLEKFFICKELISLNNLLSLFKRKYKSVNYNMIHILKSLVYFEDAENNPMPKMIVHISWQEVKSFFKEEI